MSLNPLVAESPRSTRRTKRLHWSMKITAGLVIVLVLGVSLIRTIHMWGVPNAPEPFDIEAFQNEVVPEGENSYPLYLRAKERMGENRPSLAPVPSRAAYDWLQLTPEAQTWVDRNQPALELWREATNRLYLQPYPANNPQSPIMSSDLPDAGIWTSLAMIQASRLETENDPGGAWLWHKALLRFWLQQHRRAGLIGGWSLSSQWRLSSRADKWADHQSMTVPLLRKAIIDLEAMATLYPKRSDKLKAYYLDLARMIDNHNVQFELALAPRVAGGPLNSSTLPEPLRPLVSQFGYVLAAEPERSRRVLRLAFANWLDQADKPSTLRAKVVSADPLVFETEPGKKALISPRTLASQMDSAPLIRFYRGVDRGQPLAILKIDDWPNLIEAERRTIANLIITYASRIYELETGKWPTSPEALVGKVLPKLPNDYLPPDGGDESTIRP